jgi:hypothetical protein
MYKQKVEFAPNLNNLSNMTNINNMNSMNNMNNLNNINSMSNMTNMNNMNNLSSSNMNNLGNMNSLHLNVNSSINNINIMNNNGNGVNNNIVDQSSNLISGGGLRGGPSITINERGIADQFDWEPGSPAQEFEDAARGMIMDDTSSVIVVYLFLLHFLSFLTVQTKKIEQDTLMHSSNLSSPRLTNIIYFYF